MTGLGGSRSVRGTGAGTGPQGVEKKNVLDPESHLGEMSRDRESCTQGKPEDLAHGRNTEGFAWKTNTQNPIR